VTPRAQVERLFDARDAWERDYILSALAGFEGNISRTADALGLERSNLYKKMRALGISGGRRDEDGAAGL
jgi:two-component system nitrogen regulation response regulator NtrX